MALLAALAGSIGSATAGAGTLLTGAGAAGATGAAGVSGAALATAAPSTFLGLTGTQLTGLSIAGSLGAGALGVAGSLNQARATAGQQKRAAAIASQQVARDRQRRLGTLRAQIGASGAALSGSPLSVLAEQSSVAEHDRLLSLAGGRISSQRTLQRGESAAISAGIGGFSGALRGATTLTRNRNFRSRFGV